jgi:hypothetical protein
MQVGCTDNCKLTKEQCPYFTQDIDYQKVLNLIKAEVAREIFAEIDVMCIDIFGNLNHKQFAELKKKYTGENSDGL